MTRVKSLVSKSLGSRVMSVESRVVSPESCVSRLWDLVSKSLRNE